MSVSFSNLVLLQCGHWVPGGKIVSDSGVNQASAPDLRKSSTTFWLMALSFSGLPQAAHRSTAMGTPQTRCREMHQSGRVSIMFDIRSSPQDVSHFTLLISSSVRERSVWFLPLPPGMGVSIEMNHCSVARKITGLWQRQQCGYECSVFSVWSRAPRDFTNSIIGWFASQTRWPVYSGRPLRRIPFSSTLLVASRPYLTPVMKSSAPCEGAVWTTPVTMSMVTYSASTPRTLRSRNGCWKFRRSSFCPGKCASGLGAARLHRNVLFLGMKRDCHGGRKRPRRRGPDDRGNFFPRKSGIELRGIVQQPILYPNRAAGVVRVFDFGFGQRGFVVHAPVHSPQALVNESVLVKRKERR